MYSNFIVFCLYMSSVYIKHIDYTHLTLIGLWDSSDNDDVDFIIWNLSSASHIKLLLFADQMKSLFSFIFFEIAEQANFYWWQLNFYTVYMLQHKMRGADYFASQNRAIIRAFRFLFFNDFWETAKWIHVIKQHSIPDSFSFVYTNGK